jgi:hypothetical protein
MNISAAAGGAHPGMTRGLLRNVKAELELCAPSCRKPTELIYEATIPTVENPPQAAARLFEPQFEQERPGHFAQSPPRRAQTADACLRVK